MSSSKAGASESRTIHGRAVSFASEQVQAIDKVYHTEAVDGIIFSIAPHGCTDGSADIALVLQNIVELDTDGCGIPFQEVL